MLQVRAPLSGRGEVPEVAVDSMPGHQMPPRRAGRDPFIKRAGPRKYVKGDRFCCEVYMGCAHGHTQVSVRAQSNSARTSGPPIAVEDVPSVILDAGFGEREGTIPMETRGKGAAEASDHR